MKREECFLREKSVLQREECFIVQTKREEYLCAYEERRVFMKREVCFLREKNVLSYSLKEKEYLCERRVSTREKSVD